VTSACIWVQHMADFIFYSIFFCSALDMKLPMFASKYVLIKSWLIAI